ncbi:hypothetical protein ACT3CD_11710 [Geofilum sp. OHC36d9]|uniref:hypothetical protein n=1 Tax=Geofilum sp. OHC36d9 TaxID=3458413 RepID=UPI0040339C55
MLNRGFVEKDGCYLLKHFSELQNHMELSDFEDRTGYECFINSFHVDDYVRTNVFKQAILFLNKLLIIWDKQNNNLSLEVILSKTNTGFHISFYVRRIDECWIPAENVDDFKEAILICRS